MTFYNYIENARYEMFRLVNGWTREGAETKARILESLDNARIEYMQKESENAKMRELIQKSWKWEKNGCYECPLEKDCKVLCVYDGDCGIAVEIEKGLQELGIEVVE